MTLVAGSQALYAESSLFGFSLADNGDTRDFRAKSRPCCRGDRAWLARPYFKESDVTFPKICRAFL